MIRPLAFAGLLVFTGCQDRLANNPPDGDSPQNLRHEHASACGDPLPGWRRPGEGWHNLIINSVGIDADGSLRWNHVPLDRALLRRYLRSVNGLRPPAATVLHVQPGASCETVRTIRQDMEEKLQCSDTLLCGEGEADWLNGEYRIDTNSALARETEARADAIAAGQK